MPMPFTAIDDVRSAVAVQVADGDRVGPFVYVAAVGYDTGGASDPSARCAKTNRR